MTWSTLFTVTGLAFRTRVLEILDEVQQHLKEIRKQMSDQQTQLDADSARLLSLSSKETQILSAVNELKSQDAATIASLKQQVADLTAANPGIDLSGLEANITALEANTAEIISTIAPAVTPVPVSSPPA